MMYDILDKKRKGFSLTEEEIEYIVTNYINDTIPDYQMSALLMAICINGMSKEETINLTKKMAVSGETIDLSNISNTVDKHSTGGIGDKTTLIVGPIVACLGCAVAKMSGRGLGFTGGTIDKLESIEGFKIKLTKEEFIEQVKKINISIIGQSDNINPADKKIYALRDVTATVESISLIASSIMSKKIASGAKNLVLDIKVGTGAFIKDLKSARKLAKLMINIGKSCGINTVAVLTNMDIPLGNKIGNLLEVQEAIEVLKNKGPNDLKEVCIVLAAKMNSITNKISYSKSLQQVNEVLKSGKAYEKFTSLIKEQGGSLNNLNKKSKYSFEIYSDKIGYINNIDGEMVGKICVMLGAGRNKITDNIDYTAGIVLNKKLNDYIDKNTLIATIYTSKKLDIENIKKLFLNCIKTSNKKIKSSLVLDIIE